MIRGIIGGVLCLIISLAGSNLFACEAELGQRSRETLKVYIETISKKGNNERFNKEIAETLIEGAMCDSSPLPPLLDLKNIRGYYQGIFILFGYAGIKNAAGMPDLKTLNENYERLIKLQRESKID